MDKVVTEEEARKSPGLYESVPETGGYVRVADLPERGKIKAGFYMPNPHQPVRAELPPMDSALSQRPFTNLYTPVSTLLAERGKTHGDFASNGEVCQNIRDVYRSIGYDKWHALSGAQRLALDEIALKIARILSGGHDNEDSWSDIGGYSELGRKACSKGS